MDLTDWLEGDQTLAILMRVQRTQAVLHEVLHAIDDERLQVEALALSAGLAVDLARLREVVAASRATRLHRVGDGVG